MAKRRTKKMTRRCFGQHEGPSIAGWTPMTGVMVGVIAGVIVQFIADRWIRNRSQ
jgi:hypothetical protein